MSSKLSTSPFLVYSDLEGNIYESDDLYALGRSGYDVLEIDPQDWIPLPEGGSLFSLSDRQPLGVDVHSGELGLMEGARAVAAFIPPAYMGLYTAAYDTMPEAELLSLFCYTAVGWYDGSFYVPAVRVEQDIRQEAGGFDTQKIKSGVEDMLQRYPQNRIVKHLAENCYDRYDCPAAKNYFLNRWECPVPASPACNANCVGCISLQEDEVAITSPQDRLDFKPSAEEIVEYTVPHLLTAEYPIVSFGQGCEGEPLLMWETIGPAIREIRKHTDRGMINMNTNASRPNHLESLMKAGLNSIRVSTNSVQEKYYDAYYRPNNYSWQDVVESVKTVKKYQGWVSMNYFVFPGFTDSEEEYEALRKFIAETNIDLIQWRNLNIDPEYYLHKIQFPLDQKELGMKNILQSIQEEFPYLKFGYFNPSKERIANYDNVPK